MRVHLGGISVLLSALTAACAGNDGLDPPNESVSGGAASSSKGGSAASAGSNSAAGTSSGGSSTCSNGGSPPGPSSQDPGTWLDVTPDGTEGEFSNAIAVDPARPSDVYVNIDHQGVWRSTDHGLSWTKTSTGFFEDSTGAAYMAIDKNPCRAADTAPVMFVTSIYESGGAVAGVVTTATKLYVFDGFTTC